MFKLLRRLLGKASPEPMATQDQRLSDALRPSGHMPSGDDRAKGIGSTKVHWSERDIDAEPVGNPFGDREDHLGKAAQAKHAAKQAIREKRFDDAWRLLHEQQSEWLAHANRSGMTVKQTLSLLSSIHEDMANVLRLEGRHDEAMAHLLYCVATNTRPTQTQQKKVGTYFRRCKFGDKYGEDRADVAVSMLSKQPDLRMAREIVKQWRDGTAPTGRDE